MKLFAITAFIITSLYMVILAESNENKKINIEEIEVVYKKNEFYIAKDKNLYGVLNSKNELILPFDYKEIYLYKNGNGIVKNQKNEYLFIADKIKVDVEKIYPSISDYLIYEKNEKFGIIRLRDLKIYENIFKEIELQNSRYLIAGKFDNKYTILDLEKDSFKDDEKIKFDYIDRVGKETFIAGTDEIGKFAFVYKNFENVTEEKYEDIIVLSRVDYIGITDNCYDLLNYRGEIRVSFKKNEFKILKDKLIVTKDNQEKEYMIGEKEL
ncbi:MAG: hypothetical protein ACRC3I_03255 [Cetobacterium sp.]